MPAIENACDWIRRGGIIAYPTEAVFGLGCDPLNTDALNRLLDIKGRERHKGFILVASRMTQLNDYVQPLTQELQTRVSGDWPGPVTWVLPAAKNLPGLLTGFRDSIAVRVSAHQTVVALCDSLNQPLVSTSANLQGEPELRTANAVAATFGDQIDCIVEEPIGDQPKPSAIFDARTMARIR